MAVDLTPFFRSLGGERLHGNRSENAKEPAINILANGAVYKHNPPPRRSELFWGQAATLLLRQSVLPQANVSLSKRPSGVLKLLFVVCMAWH